MGSESYKGIFAPKGKGYPDPLPLPLPDPAPEYDNKGKKKPIKLPKGGSYYALPIIRGASRAAGNSRIHGDASHDVQKKAIDAIIEAANKHKLGQRETAYVLAMARVESGFNPDAAAGTTTASGLGQFVRATGWGYGLNDSNRFDLTSNADALVRHFINNRDIAKHRGFAGNELEIKIYQYHHDGAGTASNPAKDRGGRNISINQVIPLTNKYEQFLNGNTITTVVTKSKINTNTGSQVAKNNYDLYLVKPGDTLNRISRIHGIPIAEIQAANPIVTNINQIYVGQKLIIPVRKASVPSNTTHQSRSSVARKPRIANSPKQSWSLDTLRGWIKRYF